MSWHCVCRTLLSSRSGKGGDWQRRFVSTCPDTWESCFARFEVEWVFFVDLSLARMRRLVVVDWWKPMAFCVDGDIGMISFCRAGFAFNNLSVFPFLHSLYPLVLCVHTSKLVDWSLCISTLLKERAKFTEWVCLYSRTS